MPKIVLDLESNLPELFSVLSRGEELVSKTGNAVIELGKDSKVAFSIAATESDKFSNEVKAGTKQVTAMDAAAKLMNKTFADSSKPQSLEEKKIAAIELKKQIDDLLVYEQKLLQQQQQAGPANIKEQFNDPIIKAQAEVDELRKKLEGLSNIKIKPQVSADVDSKIKKIKEELETISKASVNKNTAASTSSVGSTELENGISDVNSSQSSEEIAKIHQLTNELKSLEEQKKKITLDKTPLIANIELSTKELHELKTELNSITEQATKLHQEGDLIGAKEASKRADELRKKLESVFNPNLAATTIDNKIAQIKAELTGLTQIKSAASSTNTEVKASAITSTGSQVNSSSNTDAETAKVQRLTEELKKLEAEKDKVTSNKKPLITNVEVLTIAIDKLEKELKDITEETERMRAEGDIIGAESSVKRTVELERRIKELSNTKINIGVDITSVESKIAAVKSQIESVSRNAGSSTQSDTTTNAESNRANNTTNTTQNVEQTTIKVKQLTDELKKLEEEKKKLQFDNKPLINSPENATNALKRIRQEIKAVTAEAIRLRQEGDIIGADAAIKKAGELRDELKDVQDAIKAVSGNANENLAGAFGKATQIGAMGFEGVLAVQSLVGAENENIQKQLLKLQAIQSIARLAGEFGDLKDRLKEIKLGLAPITNLYTRGNDAIKNFFKGGAKGADDLTKSNKGLFSSLSGGIKSFVSSGITNIKSLWAVVAANPLGVILTVLGALIVAMVALKDKIKPIGALFEFLGNVVDKLLYPFEKLGQLLGLIATESEKTARKLIANTEEDINAIKRLYDYEISLATARNQKTSKLEDEKTQAIQEALLKRLEAFDIIRKENGKLDEEELKQYKEFVIEYENTIDEFNVRRAKLQQERIDKEREILSRSVDAKLAIIKDDEQRESAQIRKRYQDQEDEIILSVKKLYDTEVEQTRVGSELVADLRKQRDKELADIAQKYYLKRQEELKQLRALELSFQTSLKDLANKVAQAQASSAEEKIEIEKQLAINQLSIVRDNLIKQGQEVENFQAKIEHRRAKTFKLSAEQESQFSALQQSVYNDATQKLIQLEVDRQNKIASARAANAQQTEANLGTEEGNAISSVQLMAKPKDMSAVDFELEKQKAIFKIQQEYALKRLELQQKTLAAEREAQIKALNGQLALLQERNDEDAKIERERVMKDLEILEQKYALEGQKIMDETAKLINSLQAERDKLNKLPPIDLFKLMGLKPEDVQNIQLALNSLGDGLSSFIDLQEARLDKEIEQSEERQGNNEKDISDLENKLKTEQDLALAGKANNSALIQAQLAEKQEAQAKEAELQKKQLEEKKAFQKQQLIIDTITQASGIITASANILANTARDPITLAIALTAIGAMIAGFTAAKVNAFKAVNEGLNLKDGDIDIKGPGTETSDSIPANLSRGESVMTAKETKENKTLFTGIRKKSSSMIMEGISTLLKNTGVTLPRPNTKELAQKRDHIKGGEIKLMVNNHTEELRKEQQITNKKLDELISEQKNKVFSDGTHLFTIKGNHTTKRKL